MSDRCFWGERRTGAWDGLFEQIKAESAPFYLFQEAMIRDNIHALRRYFGGRVRIAYAMKANPWLCKAASSAAEYIEVSSGGELEICADQGIPGNKLMADGVWRSERELQRALALGVSRFGVNSVRQMEQLVRASEGKDLQVFLRVTSGNQFGMEPSEVQTCMELGRSRGNIRIKGFQFFPGTQRMDARKVERELACLERWIAEYQENLGLFIEEIEFGAGIGVPYFEKERVTDYEQALDAVQSFIHKITRSCQVTYEAGRIVAASCGIYVTEVFDEKWRGARKILFCMGGINHLRYHGGILGARTPRLLGLCSNPEGTPINSMICGSSCSESDVLVRECLSLDKNFTIGDRVLFMEAGAYSGTEASSLFLSMDLPRVLLYDGKDIRCVRDSLATYRLINNLGSDFHEGNGN